MATEMKRMTDFLLGLGIDKIDHTSKSYLAHLVGLYRDLQARGCPEDVCRAGMFHSIYGTELFQGFKLPLERRDDIRALIGERAERLAYLNCAMDRTSFDRTVARGAGPYRFRDRLTGAEVELNRQDFDDLCRIHLYDWIEQVGRSQNWDYRRAAYRNLAEYLNGAARADYDRTFAQEAAAPAAG
jgi:hypothetical protein